MGKLNASMCSFQHLGNAVTVPYIDLSKYFTDNIYRKEVLCPLECNTKFDSLEEAFKHFDTCGMRLVQCEGCEEIHKFGDSEKHDNVCIEKVIECTEKCGVQVKRKDLEQHLQKSCLGERYKCDKCDGWINERVKDKHICSNYLMQQLIKKFDGIESMMKADREFQDSKCHEDHLIVACDCSSYCLQCDRVLQGAASPVVVKSCGVYCPKCNKVLVAKHPGFGINQLGNAVCFDCRKIVVKKDPAVHFCINFTENCQ